MITAAQASVDATAYSENLLGYLLGRAHFQFLAGFRPVLDQRGLSDADFFVLWLPLVRAPLAAAQIAEHVAFIGIDIGPPALVARGLLLLSDGGYGLTAAGSVPSCT